MQHNNEDSINTSATTMLPPILAKAQHLLDHVYVPYVGAAMMCLFLAVLEDVTLLPSLSELVVTFVALFCGLVLVVAPSIYVLDWVEDVLEGLGEVVLHNDLQKETEMVDAAEGTRSSGFEYTGNEGEERIHTLSTTPTSAQAIARRNLKPPQERSITRVPTLLTPAMEVDSLTASTDPVPSPSAAGHTPHPRSHSRPTWTSTNTPPPPRPSPFDLNPAPGTSLTCPPSTSSTAGQIPYPRHTAPPAHSMATPLVPSILRPDLLPPMPPTPHHASGLLGPSPAPKRILSHFSLEAIHEDIAIREALFKKPGRPVSSKVGVFGNALGGMETGMGESVGERGLRRARLRGGWRYVPEKARGDGEAGEGVGWFDERQNEKRNEEQNEKSNVVHGAEKENKEGAGEGLRLNEKATD
jgi:hypothetical protein